MTDLAAKGKIKRVQLDAVVVRADGTRHDLGTISDSARRWRYGPGRVLALLRTRRANRLAEGK